MKANLLFIILTLFFSIFQSQSQIISFSPQADTIFVGGSCFVPSIFCSVEDSDSLNIKIKIRPTEYHMMWINDSVGYPQNIPNCYFLSRDSLGIYSYQLWIKSLSPYPTPPQIIPFDSIFSLSYYTISKIYLYLLKDDNVLDSMSQVFTAKYGLGVGSDKPENQGFKILSNYPNPFNPTTNIDVLIPYSEFITLKIYNISGDEIETIFADLLSKGRHKLQWKAERYASGIYLLQLQVGNYKEMKKILLLK